MPFFYIITYLLKFFNLVQLKLKSNQNGATPSQKAYNPPLQGLGCTLLGKRGSHKEWGVSGFLQV